MSWAKIDDLLPHHSKMLMAGRDAAEVFGVYVASICYAQRHWTDGFIPKTALSVLLPGCPRIKKRIIHALVGLRLWEEQDGGWQIHDYLEHNLSAEERRVYMEANATRQRVHRNKLRNAVTNDVTNASVTGRTPLHSSPLPSTPNIRKSGLGATAMPDGLPATRVRKVTQYPTTEAEEMAYRASRGGGA